MILDAKTIIGLLVIGVAIYLIYNHRSATSTYVGCYVDNKNDGKDRGSSVEIQNMTIDKCREYAKKVGANTFAFRAGNPNTGIGVCATDNTSTVARFTQYGKATECTRILAVDTATTADYPMSAPDWRSAVYSI